MSQKQEFSLKSKYLQEEGTIILSGLQALVRLPLDQHRADERQGLHTGTLISGYRGSPLGGYDFLLQRNQKLLHDHHTVFIPGVNEDLAATAIFGSQTVNLMPDPKYDGVVGIWYGKGPGVDRTGDIFKHAQIAGVGKNGGVLALAGDDPIAKSSTIPSHSEVALYDAQMPVLYPGNVQEILDMGRLGFELSRYSGSWVGFKIVTNVADEFGTAYVSPDHVSITLPDFSYNGRAWQPTQNPALLAPHSLNQEREIHEGRLEAAKLFAAANKINRITINPAEARIGIVSAGKTYYDVREALLQLGLDDEALERYGIRLLKIGMLYPMEPTIVREFARGLDEIFVIEEKRAFMELFIRDVLYNEPARPLIVGKRDEQGNFLVRGDSELDADQITELLGKRLSQQLPPDAMDAFNRRLTALQAPQMGLSLPMLARTPYFCSGCPHNRSTKVPEDSLVGGGIGCHSLALLMDRKITGLTQMGGEGAQWIGAAPFSNVNHIFQNIGDGTLFHSGSLSIRQAVAAGTNITYKILHNNAVAMTGGQAADGAIPVPELTRALQAEGVRKIMVVTHDLDKYPKQAKWADDVDIWERDRLDEAQRILRDIPGVTALIYDQPCATDIRRKRKRGLAPDPAMRVFINEAVCEGCGDCGEKSNCLSVFPVETEFGRKTQIHQSTCNKDYTCLEGDCPAFISVIPAEKQNGAAPKPKKKIYRVERELPDPQYKTPADHANLYMMGIGGTGVVTINQILAIAAFLDGKQIRSLDQTGLSQKGGPVVSHLKLYDEAPELSNKVAKGQADAYIVFDMLSGTTDQNLSHANPHKTIAVVSSSQIPTGSMVQSTAVRFPQGKILKSRLEAYTQAEQNVYLDAIKLAENLFGGHMPANIITIGAAYQAGVIPISADAIEEAIRINGVAVEANIQAFRVGRLVVADPEWEPTLALERPGTLDVANSSGNASRLPERSALQPKARALVDRVGADGELRRLLEIRVPELIAYQSVRYARKYVDFVKQVFTAEQSRVPGDTRLSQAVARHLFKLMAYKDEYEVARLYMKPEFTEAVTKQFGTDAKVEYRLHPPFLRYLGVEKKISLGKWFDKGFNLLTKMKALRGTPLDLFGYAEVRRVERKLISEYRTLIEETLLHLTPEGYQQAVQLAQLPDIIRGYEDIKLKNIERYRQEVRNLKKERRRVPVA
ncbi:MAG: indolepyruvate ferredoxin oxidoreductase family protein [Ardenticatenaceae bacterium]